MNSTTAFPVTWDLDRLMPRPETGEFRAKLAQFRESLRAVAQRSEELPQLGDQAAHKVWLAFLQDYEALFGLGVDLQAFVECHAAADARNRNLQQLEAELSALSPLREQTTLNIELALRNASNEIFEAFIQSDAWLRERRFFLEDKRRHAQLRLPKPLELFSAGLAVDGLHAWGRLYDRVSGALRIPVMERGEIVEKSPGQVQFDSPERSVRENNFFAAQKAWGSIADNCADALNHISGTRLTVYRTLGLADHLEAPLRYNRMQRGTLDAMWKAVAGHKSGLVRYLNKKAELLGLEKLAWYDVTAPLPVRSRTAEAKLSYDRACDLIISAFREFSADLGDFAEMALREKWVEAENREGKRQGGFCTGLPIQRESRIFMTFTESRDSMSTLAHELGHAYHSWVLREQPLALQEYPMNLAETASTFAEAIVGEQQLAHATDNDEKLLILDQMLGDGVAFLMNIHARFMFEDRFHRERGQGELTVERFSDLMLEAQREAYEGCLAEDGWYPGFWISKLHFYISGLPFYNFPYTFGWLLSQGAFAMAREMGPEFPSRYRELLIATGCQQAEDAVASTLGYDLSTPDFWDKSLEMLDQRVEEFLKLAG